MQVIEGTGLTETFTTPPMNVFDCANGCIVKVYYQDTGSIHLNHGNVDKIAKRYKEIQIRFSW